VLLPETQLTPILASNSVQDYKEKSLTYRIRCYSSNHCETALYNVHHRSKSDFNAYFFWFWDRNNPCRPYLGCSMGSLIPQSQQMLSLTCVQNSYHEDTGHPLSLFLPDGLLTFQSTTAWTFPVSLVWQQQNSLQIPEHHCHDLSTSWVDLNLLGSEWAIMSPLSHLPCFRILLMDGARGSVVGWGTMLQAGRLRVRVPIG
jgi:hypothetical protein